MCKKILRFAEELLLCLSAAMSVCLRFAVPEGAEVSGAAVNGIFENLRQSLSGTYLALCFVFAFFIILRRYNRRNTGKPQILWSVCCLFLAAVWLMAKNFMIDNSLDSLSSTPGQCVKSVIIFAGSFWLLLELGTAADTLLLSGKDIPAFDCVVLRLYRKRPYAVTFSVLFICALPSWVVCYPGYMCSDAYCQLAYYFNIYEFVAHHPPVHTLFISLCVRLGMALGSANFGLYLSVCIQMLVLIAVFAYALCTMRSLSAPRWLMLTAFIVTAFFPSFINAGTTVLKDVIYSAFVLLFVIELVYILRLGWDYMKSAKHIALLSIAIIGTMLMRNNGKYIIYVMLLVLTPYFMLRGKKDRRMKTTLSAIVCLVLPVLFSLGINAFVTERYDIAPGSRREALSLPFMQTARYAYEHADDTTDEEREIIDTVLQYEYLALDYTPMCSDNTKWLFRDECTTAELLDYFRVWIRQGMRHPASYLKATFNQNYPLFYPTQVSFGVRDQTESSQHTHISGPLGLHDVGVAQGLKKLLSAFDGLIGLLPPLWLFESVGFYTITLMLLVALAFRHRLYRFLLAVLPSVLSTGVVFLAPLVERRYCYPVFYAAGLLLAVYLYELRHFSNERKDLSHAVGKKKSADFYYYKRAVPVSYALNFQTVLREQ